MSQIKAIYYSKKMKKYYFNNTTVFGDYCAETVYGVEKYSLETIGEIKTDKNGRQYFLGLVEKRMSKENKVYYVLVGIHRKGEVEENESAF